MKLSKFFTKIFIAIAFVAILSIFNIISLPTKAKAATLPVQLYYSQRIIDSKGGSSHLEGYVAVQNLSCQGKVTIHYTTDGKTWSDVPASYLKTNPTDNCDVWKFETPSAYPGNSTTFSIKYEANGQTYWDNNGGKNYTNTNFSKSSIFVNYIDSYAGPENNNISLFITTKNFTEDIKNFKSVKIRYTEDNWKTYNEIPASFLDEVDYSNLGWCANFDLSKSTKHIEFAVVYEVNGTEYWDNNFGSNYSVNF